MQLETISSLRRNDEGIYVAATSPDEVSYSQHGHAECYGVEDSSFWFRHRNDCIVGMIRNHGFDGGPLLDIGGGNGFVAQRLVDEGWDVVLIEPGQQGAHNAKVRRGIPNVACARIEDARFHPASFGAIGMFDVIEHIEQDRGFLSDVRPLLVPGGKLYLTVPCHSWLWSQADVHAGHFRRHTRATLEELLEGLFRIDYLSFYFQPLVLPQFLLRALPYKLGVSRDRAMLSASTEHGARQGFAVRVIDSLLNGEQRTIRQGGTIAFGASALVAATALD